MTEKLLIVEDNRTLRQSLKSLFEDEAYEVIEAASGEEGLAEFARTSPDLVIMDINLPKMSGLETIRRLREYSGVPILVLSVRGSEADKVTGLDLGADDYLAKPFGFAELLARVRALLRRHKTYEPVREKPNVLRLGGGELVIDMAEDRVLLRGQVVQLTPIERKLLWTLASKPGETFGQRELVRAVWEGSSSGTSQNLKLFILYLRRKIEPNPENPRYLQTVRGVGYRLADL